MSRRQHLQLEDATHTDAGSGCWCTVRDGCARLRDRLRVFAFMLHLRMSGFGSTKQHARQVNTEATASVASGSDSSSTDDVELIAQLSAIASQASEEQLAQLLEIAMQRDQQAMEASVAGLMGSLPEDDREQDGFAPAAVLALPTAPTYDIEPAVDTSLKLERGEVTRQDGSAIGVVKMAAGDGRDVYAIRKDGTSSTLDVLLRRRRVYLLGRPSAWSRGRVLGSCVARSDGNDPIPNRPFAAMATVADHEQDVDAAAQQDASEDAEQVDDAELNAEAAVEASLDAELDAELGKLPDSASVGDGAASIAVAARCSAEAALVAKQAMRDIHSLKVDVIERALVEAVEKARVNSATALNHSMLKQAKDYNRLAEKMANAAGREAARGACGEFKSALEAASGKIDRIHNAASLSVERNMGDKLDALAALVVKSLDAQPAAQPAATTHFDVEALHSKIEERLQASDHRVNDMLEMLKIVVDRVDAVHAQLQAVEAQRANAPTVAAPIAGPPPDDVPVEEDVGEADEEDEGEDDAPASTCCLDKADKAEEAEAAAGVGVAAAGDGVSGAAGEDASKDLDEQECKKGHDCDACHGDGEQAEDTEAAAKGSVGAFVVEAGANELTVVDSVVVRQRENFLKTQLAATSIFA